MRGYLFRRRVVRHVDIYPNTLRDYTWKLDANDPDLDSISHELASIITHLTNSTLSLLLFGVREARECTCPPNYTKDVDAPYLTT